MEKVAVLPVPDWACAMTSLPSVRVSRLFDGRNLGGGISAPHQPPQKDPTWPCHRFARHYLVIMACIRQSCIFLLGGYAGGLTLDDGHDGALLDGRRALETIGVDSTEELSLQVHVIERVGDLIVVGLDLACVWVSLCSLISRGLLPLSLSHMHS